MTDTRTSVLAYDTKAATHLPSLHVGYVILLHIVTGGIFSAVWFNRLHDSLPRFRADDPSAATGIGFLFVPGLNLFWLFFTYLRLCDRIDLARADAGLPVRSLKPLMLACCVCMLVPYVNVATLLTVQPALFAMLQDRLNELIELQSSSPLPR